MDYELAQELYIAGFPSVIILRTDGETIWEVEKAPTLTELIEACDCWIDIYGHRDEWNASPNTAYENENIFTGKTPEEAVAKLWLALNSK